MRLTLKSVLPILAILVSAGPVMADSFQNIIKPFEGEYAPSADCKINYYRKARGLGTVDSVVGLKTIEIRIDDIGDDSWLNVSTSAERTNESVGNVSTDVGGHFSWTNPMLGTSNTNYPITHKTWNSNGDGYKRTLTVNKSADSIDLHHKENRYVIPLIAAQSTENNVSLKKVGDNTYTLNFVYTDKSNGNYKKTSVTNCRVERL